MTLEYPVHYRHSYELCLKLHGPVAQTKGLTKWTPLFGHIILDATLSTQVLDQIAIHAAEYLEPHAQSGGLTHV